jgi:hypothetical protein
VLPKCYIALFKPISFQQGDSGSENVSQLVVSWKTHGLRYLGTEQYVCRYTRDKEVMNLKTLVGICGSVNPVTNRLYTAANTP